MHQSTVCCLCIYVLELIFCLLIKQYTGLVMLSSGLQDAAVALQDATMTYPKLERSGRLVHLTVNAGMEP